MNEFNPEYSHISYNKKDALAFALACQLAYDIKSENRQEEIASNLEKWGFLQFTPFDKRLGSKVDTQGFVAANDDNVLIAFCGSESLPDWLTNFSIIKVPAPFRETEVHTGFQEALFPVLLEITIALHKYNPTGDKGIWVTGHSLGGALAVLLASMFIEEGIEVRGLYTFGAPRVGDSQFSESFNEKFTGVSYRIVNEGDLVPHLPPEFLGFLHAGKATLFNENGDRLDDDVATWTKFREGIGAWMSHIGKSDLAIRDFHKLETNNGYLNRLKNDLKKDNDTVG